MSEHAQARGSASATSTDHGSDSSASSTNGASHATPPASGPAPGNAGNPVLASVPMDAQAASAVLYVMSDIVNGQNGLAHIGAVDARYANALMKMNLAFHGSVEAQEKLQALDSAWADLAPACSAYDAGGYAQVIVDGVAKERDSLADDVARDKVQARLDSPPQESAHLTFQTAKEEDAEAQRGQLLEAVGALVDTGETLTGAREAGLDAMDAKEGGAFDETAMGRVEPALAALGTVHGILELSSGEALEEAKEAKFDTVDHALAGVGSYAELISQITELVHSYADTIIGVAKMVGKVMKNAELVEKLSALGDKLGPLGVVVDLAGMIKDESVLADDKASTDDKLDAGVDLVGSAVEKAGPVGFAAGTAIKIGWAALKGIADMYGQLEKDFLGGMDEGLQTLADAGSNLAHDLGSIALLGPAADAEKDPRMQKAYHDKIEGLFRSVAGELEHMLDLVTPAGLGAGDAHPGNWATIAQAFVPLQSFRGLTDPNAVISAAQAVLETTRSCLANASTLREGEKDVYTESGASGL